MVPDRVRSRAHVVRLTRMYAAVGALLTCVGCDGSATVVELSLASTPGLALDSLVLEVTWEGETTVGSYPLASVSGQTVALWFPRNATGLLEISGRSMLSGVETGSGQAVIIFGGARRIEATLLLEGAGSGDGGGIDSGVGSDAGTDSGPPAEVCGDGTDNDGDGDVDCDDFDCQIAGGCQGAYPIPFAPEAPGGTGFPGCDDCTSGLVPIGFDFVFFGVTYSEVNVSTNGFISFDPGVSEGCCNGPPLPTDDSVNDVIAAWWTDLDSLDDQIRYETLGTAPNRRFVVTFEDLYNFVGNIWTQIILYEGTDLIEIHTEYASPGPDDVTQGVENAAGTEAYFIPGRTAASSLTLMDDAVRFVTN